MRANKIGIVLEKTATNKYNVQVVGLNEQGHVVGSVSELEERGISFASASRAFDRLWATIKLRLSRGQLELLSEEKGHGKVDGRG